MSISSWGGVLPVHEKGKRSAPDRWGFDNTPPLFVAEDCTTVIWARKGPPSPEGTLILYDLARGVRLSQFSVNSYVTPHYLPRSGTLVTERYGLVPMGENSARERTLGKIDFYSKDGTPLGTLDVPKDGTLLGVSPDGTLGFHLSPWLLSVLNLQTRRIQFQVAIPFTEAKVGWFDRSESGR